ncbi:MAG TPA: hypothetical protein VFN59_00505 [Acidimicrobiales bacterium]|nr:hypothetical protein [Acidimicrobiales bacterium]
MRTLRRASCLLVALVLVSSLTSVAGAAPTRVAARRAALPAGGTGVASGLLTTLACPAPGVCEAAGSFTGAGKSVYGVVLNERAGRWVAPSLLVAPADAGANPGTTVSSLACPAPGRCVVGGSYADGAGDGLAFVADQSGDAWHRALAVTLPADALGPGQSAAVRSVACGAPGSCVAVGSYLDNARIPRTRAFVALEAGGRWAPAQTVALPTPANLDPFAALDQVACASAAHCVAVGSYIDANDVTQGLVVSIDAGTLSASVVAPPADASTYAGTALDEVTCLGDGTCTAVGTYISRSGAVVPLVDSSSSPVWPQASALSLPAGARRDPKVLLYGYQGISCSGPGECATGGQYVAADGRYQGFLATETRGVWHRATTMPVPAGANSGGPNGGVVAVTCPTGGSCRAGGAYLDHTGHYQALVLTLTGGAWRGSTVALPGGATTVGVDGGLYAIACAGAHACVGVGSYERGATYQGFTLRA